MSLVKMDISLFRSYTILKKIMFTFISRQHPKLTYKLPVYGHKAPMSCTVTLTEPYNPFNKIVKEEIVY